MSFQKTIKALSDPTRRKILDLIKDEPKMVSDILEEFSISGASISHHLSILKDANLVIVEKKGKYIYYEINASVLDEVISWFQELRDSNEK